MMKKIFIYIISFLMPIIIFIVLYRKYNGVDEPFNLMTLLNYFSKFDLLKYYKEFFNNDIIIKLEQIKNDLYLFNSNVDNPITFIIFCFQFIMNFLNVIISFLKLITDFVVSTLITLFYVVNYILGFFELLLI